MTSDELIRSSEAAEILGLTQRTFNRRVEAGEIVPAVELPGDRTRLFKRSAIEAMAKDAAA